MNRGEASGLAFILGIVMIIGMILIWYILIFNNLLLVSSHLGYDIAPVESELWWMFIGFGLLVMIRAGTKTYRWIRRDYCNHCGKELDK